MPDWRAERIKEWRYTLNTAYDHDRLIHIALRSLPTEPLGGYIRSRLGEDAMLASLDVLIGDDSCIVVSFSLDDILIISRGVGRTT